MNSTKSMNRSSRGSLRTRFASRFLDSLRKMSALRSVRRRSQLIKITADASMASSVGPHRAWSRAVLFNLLSNDRSRTGFLGRRRKTKTKKRGQEEDQLRKLVPGGETMDRGMLLDETAHYIKCLSDQVMVMRSIVVNYLSLHIIMDH